jgi:hypothetical protein
MKKLLIAAGMAAALAFASGKTMASSGSLILNVSGTAKYQYLDGSTKGTVESHSFTEKNLYSLITNAVANWSGGLIPSANFPADGYIVYNPGGSDGEVTGGFYVTNKTGFYYPLSGSDSDLNYYSWIELDTEIFYGEDSSKPLGWYDYDDTNSDNTSFLFYDVDSYSLNSSGNGSDTSTSTALFYVHDDPYLYNDSTAYKFDDEDLIYGDYNENALEIRGLLTATLTLSDYEIKSGSISISGTGNFVLDDYYYFGVVSSGSAKLSP